MAKTTFTVNEKPNRPDLNVADNFLMETAENKTLKAALGSIYSFIKSLLVSESQLFDHANIKNIGTKTHTQIDTFINNSAYEFATAAQGQKADSAVQPTDNIPKANVGLGQVDNTSDVDKPISTATQLAIDKKENLIQSRTILYVDSTRVDTYTETGSPSLPYKSMAAVMSHISADIIDNYYHVILAPATYIDSGLLSIPNKNIYINGNYSLIQMNININDGNIVFINSDIVGDVNINQNSNSIFENTSFTGLLTLNGNITIRNSSINGAVSSASTLTIKGSTLRHESASEYVVTSATGGTLNITDCRVFNSIGNGISCDNGASDSIDLYNCINNSFVITKTDGISVNCGSASTMLSKNKVSGLVTGTNIISMDADVLASSSVNMGNDAIGDIYYRNASGKLTRLGIGVNGYELTSDGIIPVWTAKPVDIPGNAATATLATATTKLATSRTINGVGFDGTQDITIVPTLSDAATKLATARTINGIPFDGTQNITIEAEDPYNSNNLLEVDLTNGDVIIDSTNCQFAGYILTGAPTKQVSLIITVPNKYFKIINNITTDYPVIIESGI